MIASRVIFGLVLLGVALGVVYWEVVSLLAGEKESVAMANLQSDGGGAVLGESGDGGERLVVVGEVGGGDARLEVIKRYLEKYRSPLWPYAKLILELSDKYRFEYYWMVAIAQQESNLCKKIPTESYNCWGYGINSAGTLRFGSYEAAITSFAEYLDREYFEKGYDTPELIMKKYCPQSNGSWAYGVEKFIRELEASLGNV